MLKNRIEELVYLCHWLQRLSSVCPISSQLTGVACLIFWSKPTYSKQTAAYAAAWIDACTCATGKVCLILILSLEVTSFALLFSCVLRQPVLQFPQTLHRGVSGAVQQNRGRAASVQAWESRGLCDAGPALSCAW